jgi:hypothetical protein
LSLGLNPGRRSAARGDERGRAASRNRRADC